MQVRLLNMLTNRPVHYYCTMDAPYITNKNHILNHTLNHIDDDEGLAFNAWTSKRDNNADDVDDFGRIINRHGHPMSKYVKWTELPTNQAFSHHILTTSKITKHVIFTLLQTTKKKKKEKKWSAHTRIQIKG